MLSLLRIKNIALIKECEIEFSKGLIILSGETGAGKSIIIDSLNFVLGERADKSLIRHQADQAWVEAVFQIEENADFKNTLSEYGIECEDGELLIFRKMTIEGKNECRINGRIVTLSVLRSITSFLCDIHGQHEHQSLLKVGNHIKILDDYSNLGSILEEVSSKYHKYSEILRKIERFGNEADRRRREDALRFQLNEIRQAALREDEEEGLYDRFKVCLNMEKIITSLREAESAIEGESDIGAISMVGNAIASMQHISDFGDDFQTISTRLKDVIVELQDISYNIKNSLENYYIDEKEMKELEERIDLIKLMKKKYGDNIKQVLLYAEEIQKELDEIQDSELLQAQLDEALKNARHELYVCSCKLSELREQAALKLEKSIMDELSDMGMKNTVFKVSFSQREPESSDDIRFSANGFDVVEFLISPNVGEPLKPLSKIISGGEMSRFMLALKNIIATTDKIGTLVFDEIDTGISGHIAEAVAKKLYCISKSHQVLAVTHLPQLASMADYHFLISKHVESDATITNLKLLSQTESIKELTRLVGGEKGNEYAALHAGAMKEMANNYKQSILKN